MSSSNLVSLRYKKETTYGETPASTRGVKIVQDITYTAKYGGSQSTNITIAYANTAVAGLETVTVTGNAIVVGIQTTVSTATQVLAAINGSAAALALVTAAITGTAGTAQVTATSGALSAGTGEFKTARFISEQYSGSPETTESQQIRTDRMSSGQVVTGLTVAGGHSFELAKETALEDFMESAMFAAWVTTPATITASIALDATAKTMTVASGFTAAGFVVGDFVQLSNFASDANNVVVMVTAVSDTVISYVGPEGMATITESATITRGDKLAIGSTKKSLSIEKAFTDLTTKAINYRGMIASAMDLKVEYGSLISGSFEMSGNDYEPADSAAEFMSYLSYITAAATTDTMNGSVDMPFLATDVTNTWDTGDFCIQSLDMKLSNNLSVQTCIGRAAPENYNPGTANIEITLSSYLKDGNWDMLARKLTQESFGIGFVVQKGTSWYGFYMPAIQVSFDDPASAGANQDVSMDMTGQAKVGDAGESALTIYKFA